VLAHLASLAQQPQIVRFRFDMRVSILLEQNGSLPTALAFFAFARHKPPMKELEVRR
jgi:hypothetical protein